MKSLKPRLLTAIIGIPAILVIVILSEFWHPLMNIALAFVTGVMIAEYLYGNKLLKNYLISVPSIIFGAAMCLLVGTKLMYVLFFALIIFEFLVIIVRHEQISYSDLAYALVGTMIITFGTASIAYICATGLSLSFFFVLIFAIPWMSDSGAFFAGNLFGKHKLCPKISPKKTVEGAIGGMAVCILSAVAMGFIFQYLITPNLKIHFIPLIIVGAFDAVLSIVGDLSFSLIKRSINIKDYGNIFPGHGGMLDRLDSIIFTVPMVLIINSFLPFLSVG